MPGNIWVVAEQWRGGISDITYEVLALGRELADGVGASVEAILLGHNMRNLIEGMGKADVVLYADHPSFAEPLAEPQAEALAQLARERKPRAILTPLTNVTLGIGTLLAAKTGAPSVNFCRNVRVEGGRLEADCVLYGGKMEARVIAGEGVVLGIWPGARPAERVEPAPRIEDVPITLPAEGAVRFRAYIEPEACEVDITQQETLVAVGRGIQSKDNLEMAEELAAALGGAVCGSRPVIDQGWLPLARQVGKSGMTVKPKLYLALGISGAPEHVEGMKDSALVVAVNTDPHAPIFNVAHYGVVADVLDIMPALTEAVQAARAAKG